MVISLYSAGSTTGFPSTVTVISPAGITNTPCSAFTVAFSANFASNLSRNAFSPVGATASVTAADWVPTRMTAESERPLLSSFVLSSFQLPLAAGVQLGE